MLEGLEAKEILYSQVDIDNEKFRLDDVFFQKDFIQSYTLVSSKPFLHLEKIIDVLTDYHANGSYETLKAQVELLDAPDYAYMVRSTDLEQSDFVNNVKYVSENAYKHLSKTKLFGGEILINKIGSPGRCYIMPNLNRPATVGMNLFMIRIKKDSGFNESYLWAYLNSTLGKKIIARKINGTVPLTIDKQAIKSLPIPKLSIEFQNSIKSLIALSEKQAHSSKVQYLQAEQTLIETLGMANFKLSTKNTNIKTFALSFGTSNRLDAEYYQPKYEEIENAIISFSGDNRLGDLIEYIDTGEYSEEYLPRELGLKFYIRSTNIKNGLIDEDVDYFVKPDEFTKFAQKGDIVTARVGTLGVFGEVTDEIAGSVYSDNVLCFKLPSSFNSSVYTLWLNSKLNWELIDRLARGSVQQRLNQETLKSLLVPIFDLTTQTHISQLVQLSFSLKAQSVHLLSVAKRAVEIAIEQDENAGLEYIKQVVEATNAT